MMYLVYIDESGNTGANLDSPDQPIHWLIALAATPAMVTQIETEMLAIAGRYFGLRAGQQILNSTGPIYSVAGRPITASCRWPTA